MLRKNIYLTRKLQRGTYGNDIKNLQLILNKLNVRDQEGRELLIDGIFGPRTKSSVIIFQKLENLKSDGVVGTETVARLGQRLN